MAMCMDLITPVHVQSKQGTKMKGRVGNMFSRYDYCIVVDFFPVLAFEIWLLFFLMCVLFCTIFCSS